MRFFLKFLFNLCFNFNTIINSFRFRLLTGNLNKKITLYGRPFIYDPFSIIIGNNVTINDGVILASSSDSPIIIEDNVSISPNVTIVSYGLKLNIQDISTGYHEGKKVIIKKNSWIASNAIILPGVIVEENCVIGAGAVLTKSTEPNSVYVGNPAKKLRNL